MPPFVESFLMNDWLSIMFCMGKLLLGFIAAAQRLFCSHWFVFQPDSLYVLRDNRFS